MATDGVLMWREISFDYIYPDNYFRSSVGIFLDQEIKPYVRFGLDPWNNQKFYVEYRATLPMGHSIDDFLRLQETAHKALLKKLEEIVEVLDSGVDNFRKGANVSRYSRTSNGEFVLFDVDGEIRRTGFSKEMNKKEGNNA